MEMEFLTMDGAGTFSYDGTIKSTEGRAQDIPYWDCHTQAIEMVKQRSLAKASQAAIAFLDPLNPKPPNKEDASVLTPEEWQARRRFSIGSSEASNVFGDSPYMGCTSEDCYRRKIGEEPFLIESQEEKRRREDLFDYGHLAEQYLHGWVRRRWPGSKLAVDTNIYSAATRPYLTANLDLMLQLPDGSWVHVEFKTASRGAKDGYENDSIPMHYKRQLIQCQHIMGVWVSYIIVMFDRDDIIVRRYERDLDAEMEQVIGEERFWNDHVLKRVPPIPLGTPDGILRAMDNYGPQSNPKMPEVYLSNTLQDAAKAIVEIDRELRELHQKERELKNRRKECMIPIVQAMGSATKARLGGGGTEYEIRYKPRKPDRKVDMERFEYEFFEVYQELVSESDSEGTRSMRIKPIRYRS